MVLVEENSPLLAILVFYKFDKHFYIPPRMVNYCREWKIIPKVIRIVVDTILPVNWQVSCLQYPTTIPCIPHTIVLTVYAPIKR